MRRAAGPGVGRVRRRVGWTVAVGAVLAAAVASPLDAAPASRTFHAHDDFFSPARLTVAPRTTLRWRAASDALEPHDVQLVGAPAGVKRFSSRTLSTTTSFARRLVTPGLYRFRCSIHGDAMTMRVRVRATASRR